MSEDAYICSMEWRAKQMVSAQTLTPVAGGLYEGQLVVWDVSDAHNDVFTRQTKFHIHGEPPVYLKHNYFAPPVGKIVHFSEREDGLYVALKLERPLEDVSGVHLSVGGFAIGGVREDGAYEIKDFAVFEASLTPTPAQPNSELVLLMKTLTDMATENEKVALENTGAQNTQKEATHPSALGYLSKQDFERIEAALNELLARVKTLKSGKEAQDGASEPEGRQKASDAPPKAGYFRKQDVAQLEAIVTELMARVDAMESERSQIAELRQELADLRATVNQILGMTQEASTQSIEKSVRAAKELVEPYVKEIAKLGLLFSEALKKTNAQRI